MDLQKIDLVLYLMPSKRNGNDDMEKLYDAIAIGSVLALLAESAYAIWNYVTIL